MQHLRLSVCRFGATVVLAVNGLTAASLAQPAAPAGPAADKIHPALSRRFATDGGAVKTWVFFRDKGYSSSAARDEAIRAVAATYDPRAVERRRLRGDAARRTGQVFDERDLPVTPEYTGAIIATGARLHVTSRWLNAVSMHATREQAERIAALPFVTRLQPVARAERARPVDVVELAPLPPAEGSPRGRLDYGRSASQLSQINLIALHQAGYTGQGVVVGVLDTGFHRTHQVFNNSVHPLNVVAEYDFINDDGNTDIEPGDPSDQHAHGTRILGVLAAYLPGQLVGGACDAGYILCKTEDTTQEVPAEEDDYVAGLEFIEAHGGDMATSSLGYQSAAEVALTA